MQPPDATKLKNEISFHVKLKGSRKLRVLCLMSLCVCTRARACQTPPWPVHYRAILLLLLLVTAAVAMTAAQQSPAVQRVSGMPRPHLFILTQTTECWTKTTPPRRTEETPCARVVVCVCTYVRVRPFRAVSFHFIIRSRFASVCRTGLDAGATPTPFPAPEGGNSCRLLLF